MNPNGQNQLWSKWAWFVQPGTIKARPFMEVRENVARFARKGFGSASTMRIRSLKRGYLIEVLSEGHPVHDPAFVSYMRESFARFFVNGFGLGTRVKMTAKLMAGSRQDGTPADQMLIVPPLKIDLEAVRLN